MKNAPRQSTETGKKDKTMNTYKFRLIVYVIVFFMIMIFGIFSFMSVENLSFIDAVYFSIVTTATVGYGDIHPQTPAGKILAILLITGGVGTFLGVVANTTEILLTQREEKVRIQKLNIVIGLFFSEIGTELLRHCIDFDMESDAKKKDLIVSNNWTSKEFVTKLKRIRHYSYKTDSRKGDLLLIHKILEQKTDFLLRLLENPMLLEHGYFTDLMRAVFHLKDELHNRPDLKNLPETDYKHLEGDITRVYSLLIREWFYYMKYLKENYPYLFSMAIRTNPFDINASVVIFQK